MQTKLNTRNPIARCLRTPTFRQRKVLPKKGKGSFKRNTKHPKATEWTRL
ncbi:ribosome alternative rescue factor ArfA [Candidatus Binatia bacterium]|nr:ribosome alternative rescue factor ArfA [Candidatus Binatia bacterium]